jgi:hypothetical protein
LRTPSWHHCNSRRLLLQCPTWQRPAAAAATEAA